MKSNKQKSNLIYKIQTSDLGRYYSLRGKIAQLKKKKETEAVNDYGQLNKKLTILLAESAQITQSIQQEAPSITLNSDLPITTKAEKLIRLLQDHQVVIVAGETGCGKTTQLPKICLQAGLGFRGKIAHTQPRRVAATSVASRIASELKTPLGGTVGYAVRFLDKTSDKTRIKLMTDGVLLAELQSDPMLSQYEVIIIDEAHERSLNIDFLLGFLKGLLKKRKELKVIVTSATIDPESFSSYFNQAPIVLIEGRAFPVEVRYQPIAESDDDNQTDDKKTNIKKFNNSLADPLMLGIRDAVDQCIAESTGDILIFSHGEHEIKTITQFLNQQTLNHTEVHPLYARLGIKEQQAIFSSSNQRKIIIATNVAETSLTIPNIVFVIDIGTARISRFSQRNKIQQLPIEKISQASAEQRKGRCGRICPGICIRLYSQDDFESRSEYTLPEIKRTNLSSVVLRLKALKVKNVEEFPFIQSPDERQWKVAFNLLFELGAMSETREILPMGSRMAHLPIDPQLARILLDKNLVAVNEMLIICSFLSVRDVRMRPHDKQQKSDQLHGQYKDKHSDIITIINLWRELQKQKADNSSSGFRRWCQKNFINFVGWLEWKNIHFQIKGNIQSLGIKAQEQHHEADEIHKSLVAGFISHIMIKTQERFYQGARGIKVWLHPSSVTFKQSSNWLLSTEMIETDKLYARSNVPIKEEWVEEIAPHLVKSHYQDIHWRKNKGQTAAFLNQTLFGLPIVNRRLIDYSKIDGDASRKLFLLDGLARDCINQSMPFLNDNRLVLNKIREEEEKLRVSDIIIQDDELAGLYAIKIPLNINNVYTLRRWLKKDWKKRNVELTFSIDDLTNKSSHSIDSYPSELFIGGVVLPLSYSFSPGESEDGVTVEIPEVMLAQFKQSDFDWLVPGYLNEKILMVMKNLPKNIRKRFIPLSETADKCAEEILVLDYLSLAFKPTLIQVIKKITGVNVEQHDINLNQLPLHLQMKFRSEKPLNKKTTNHSKPFKMLNDLLNHNKPKNEIDSASKKQKPPSNKLFGWPNEKFSLEEIVSVSGRNIRLFRGLYDHGSHVELKEYSNLSDATVNHCLGVARLLILHELKIIKDIKNGWPDRKEIERLNLRFGGFSDLFEWVVLMVALTYVNKHTSKVMDKKEFNIITVDFSKIIRGNVTEQLSKILKLLKQLNKIYTALTKLTSSVYETSVNDIKQQIKGLWNSSVFNQKGDDLYQFHCRYFQAIESRIERITSNFPKEKDSLENWHEWQEWWDDLQSENLNQKGDVELKKLFWALQEYRVSLFSTNVKTNGSISAKKLQKSFEIIEVNIEPH